MKREIAAAVAIPVVLGILFFLPPLAFDLVVTAIALLALWEFYRLAERSGHPVAKTLGMAAGGALLLLASGIAGGSPGPSPPADWGLVLAATLLLVFVCSVAPLFGGVPVGAALGSAGTTLFGVLSIPLPAGALCYLRSAGPPEGSFGPRAVLLLFLLVWGCDSFAYYVGRRFGRRRLAPTVSPNKTVEGAVGGLVGGTLIGAAAGAWLILPEFGPARGALAGAAASTAGQIGDLVESLWKRGAGVKDSGVFLPGHGGFYDRIDSLLYAGPVLAAFVATLK